MFCFDALALASIAVAACWSICCLAKFLVSAAKSASSILGMLLAMFVAVLVLLAIMWSMRLLKAPSEALCEFRVCRAVSTVVLAPYYCSLSYILA